MLLIADRKRGEDEREEYMAKDVAPRRPGRADGQLTGNNRDRADKRCGQRGCQDLALHPRCVQTRQERIRCIEERQDEAHYLDHPSGVVILRPEDSRDQERCEESADCSNRTADSEHARGYPPAGARGPLFAREEGVQCRAYDDWHDPRRPEGTISKSKVSRGCRRENRDEERIQSRNYVQGNRSECERDA